MTLSLWKGIQSEGSHVRNMHSGRYSCAQGDLIALSELLCGERSIQVEQQIEYVVRLDTPEFVRMPMKPK